MAGGAGSPTLTADVEARAEELSLSLVIELAVFLLYTVHLTFGLGAFGLELKDSIIFVLIQSLEPLQFFVLLLHFARELVLFESVFLEFGAHLDQVATLLILMLKFQLV